MIWRASPMAAAWRRLAKTEDGQKVLGDLFREGRLLEPCFVPGDPYQTAFNEGRRRLALHVLSLVNMTPERALELAELARRSYHHDRHPL